MPRARAAVSGPDLRKCVGGAGAAAKLMDVAQKTLASGSRVFSLSAAVRAAVRIREPHPVIPAAAGIREPQPVILAAAGIQSPDCV